MECWAAKPAKLPEGRARAARRPRTGNTANEKQENRTSVCDSGHRACAHARAAGLLAGLAGGSGRRRAGVPGAEPSLFDGGARVGHAPDACLGHGLVDVGAEVGHVHIRVLSGGGWVGGRVGGRAREMRRQRAPRQSTPRSSSDSAAPAPCCITPAPARPLPAAHLVDPGVAGPAIHRVRSIGVWVQDILHSVARQGKGMWQRVGSAGCRGRQQCKTAAAAAQGSWPPARRHHPHACSSQPRGPRAPFRRRRSPCSPLQPHLTRRLKSMRRKKA